MAAKLLTLASLLALAMGVPSPANLNPRWAHGTCSFKAALTQGCDPARGGLTTQVQIPVILDNDVKPIVAPNGGKQFIVNSTPYVIGMPDGNMGDGKLYITWDPDHGEGDHHGQAKWNFDGCPWWSEESGTNECGNCRWEKWNEPELVCDAEGAGDKRVSGQCFQGWSCRYVWSPD